MVKISQHDWQYVIPFIFIVLVFIGTDIFGLFNKINFAYSSALLVSEPYRGLTAHFIHADFNHLFANVFGIVVARYFFKQLQLKTSYFFILLIALIIPLQTLIQWAIDIFVFKNLMSFTVGFSGIIYGVHGFILLSAIYGKTYFLGVKISLMKNIEIAKLMGVLLSIGLLWSFLPGISLLGHFAGLMAGFILFTI